MKTRCVRVTVEIIVDGESDEFTMRHGFESDLETGHAIGGCMANVLKAISAGYERGICSADYFKQFFRYLNGGQWSDRLAEMTDTWWKGVGEAEDCDYGEWLVRHISEKPLPPESELTPTCGLSVRSRKILENLGINTRGQLLAKGDDLREWLNSQKKSSILATNEIVEWATGVKAN